MRETAQTAREARTDWALELAAPAVRGLVPYEPGKPIEALERELGIREAVKLASNENPLGPSPRALEAARAALAGIARYPDGHGHALRAALAARHGVDPACVVLGNGSNDVLDLVARAFLGPGTEAVMSAHAFAVYPIATRAAGAEAVVAPARDFGHDLEAMAARVTARTRVVWIANPNNPTGTRLAPERLRAFLEALPPHVVAVVDEAYHEYAAPAGEAGAIAWLAALPRLVVTRTFSKAHGLAGLRIGYGVAAPEVAELLNRVRQPFNANAVAQAAAQAALADEAHIARSVALNREGMAQLEAGLGELGLAWIPSAGNFLCVDVGREAAPVYEALLREGVIVRPVAGYGLPRHLRVTVGLPEENRRFLEALGRVLGR